MTNPIICLMGPTASGKTALACELVKQFPCEIISVDSAMIYRGMDIGTAKPDADTLAGAPHHLIDILDPPESYSAAQFCEDTAQYCESIRLRGNIPLLVGGTMMYFRALQQGLSVLPPADALIRSQLTAEASVKGLDSMHQRLKEVDPVAALRIHPHDTQRILRALEVYELTGTSLTYLLARGNARSYNQYINLHLLPESRAWLHQRIEQRFEQMLTDGLIDEVVLLREKWPSLTAEHPAMRCVGYRQVFDYLEAGGGDLQTLVSTGAAATRQLAKRQLTWLRHWSDTHVFSAENPASIREVIAQLPRMLDNVATINTRDHHV